jgi:Cd2+/Zn2+-exporting ATPase
MRIHDVNGPSQRPRSLYVSGVCCSTEEGTLRKTLDQAIGPENYTFNLVTCELAINAEVPEGSLKSALRRAGFDARSTHELVAHEPFWTRHSDGVRAVAAALLTGTGMVGELADLPDGLIRGILLVAILIGGAKVFVKAWKGATRLVLDMNVLMSVAVIGALLIDRWSEAAAVIVLFAVSLMLESYSTARTKRAIQSLVALSPTQANVLRGGAEVLVGAEGVGVGETLVIRPGEKIPLDGVVVEGSSEANESPITGESVPVAKRPGAHVFAGSLNGRGALRVAVTRRFEDTTLAQIVHRVQDAQQQRAPIQSFVDRFARIYTPAVLGIAVLVAFVPPLILAEPFTDWFYRSLVLLVIACPCALVISTPVTIVSALTFAARHGILIKGGKHLETAGRVKAVAFDKTGTLTEGKPVLTDILLLNSLTRDRVVELAAAIEDRSEHHLASALLAEAYRNGIDITRIPVEDFEALPGKGVRARVNGTTYYLGNHDLCEERGYCTPEVERALDAFHQGGKTTIVLGKDREVMAVLAIRDTARQQSARTLHSLRQMGLGPLVMLSGDNEGVARQLSRELGITSFRAGLLPDQKVNEVIALKQEYGTVAMVGDGINDAPALAAASVGVAMGVSGTDVALETADVVLMSDDLSRLPLLFRLSRKALAIITQNIAIALGLKLVFLFLSVIGAATLWMAVLADDGAALLVIFNGLRLLSLKENP